ncbi:MAG: hypothetical protein ACK4K7_11305 [Allosphingosinicella sp.]|uniref:hypothetical protein n=1 Tax=Allosphingosinicella sp. TaxID=2823234 RepID=UPI0039236D1F
MTTDPALIAAFGSTAVAAVALASAAALKGWRGWLELKRMELTGGGGGVAPDLRDLRARVRRLEAIADGGE